MAAEAPTTGARPRAPRNPETPALSRDAIDAMLAKARALSVAAEAIDAMVLAVEVMTEKQRALMLGGNAGSFLVDNELWTGMATLLSTVRVHAFDIGAAGEAIEVEGMQATSPAAA